MSDTQPTYLFRVSNHQVPDSGEPPTIDGDAARRYHSCFENASKEQQMFVYDYDTQQGVVWHGDAGWQRPFPVNEGKAPGRILDEAEQLWLKACWLAAQPHQE